MQTISIALMLSDNDKSQDVTKQQHFDEVNTQLGCRIVSIPLTSDQSLPTTSDHVPLFNSLDQVVTNWDYCDQDVNTVLDSVLSTIAASHFPDTSLHHVRNMRYTACFPTANQPSFSSRAAECLISGVGVWALGCISA